MTIATFDIRSDAVDAATEQNEDRRPLAGLRVLELGHLLAGPFCGHLLADFGADVVKIEPPGAGDPMREWGHHRVNGRSLWWPILARNKRSVTVNLRDERGQSLVRELMDQVDVVIENFRPGTMERWGLGYEDVSRTNPGVIFVRITGYGQDGPYSQRASYGSIGEAMGGLRHLTGDPDRPPSRTGLSLGDSLAGTFGALGALLALRERERSGRGQVVDSALYEAVLAFMESMIPEFQLGGHTRDRTGAILPNVAPSNVYPTSDGKLILIAANQDRVFQRLCDCIGMEEWKTDDRFATHSARGENQDDLDSRIAAWTSTLDQADILEMLHSHGVPAGLVYTAADMLVDPHFEARQAILTVPDKGFGQFSMQGVFPKLSATPGAVSHLGPELGEHNADVFGGSLKISAEELAELKRDGVI